MSGGFSNPLVGGGGNLVYPSIHSPNFVTGVSGWTINKDGSAEFSNVTFRGTLSGPSTVISTTGIFFYSGTPGPGNAPVFYYSTASTDPFGNAVTPNVARSVSGTAFAQLGGGALTAQDASGDQIQVTGAAVQFTPSGAGTAGTIQVNGGNELDLLAPVTPGGGNQAEIQLISSSASPVIDIGAAGIPAGNTLNLRGTVNLGASGNAQWADGTQQFTLPAGGGPFISGETFHAISGAAGLTGTMRIKKLPWNMAYLDVLVSWTAAIATTFTCGSLPDSTYYPAVSQPNGSSLFPLTSQAAWTTDTAARVFVPSSGALQVVVGASAAGGNGSFRGVYATN